MSGIATELRIGLRFKRDQARYLAPIVARLKSEGIAKDHISLFESALKAAQTGEPLVVACQTETEAIAIADGFTQFGLLRPAIEHLSGLTQR